MRAKAGGALLDAFVLELKQETLRAERREVTLVIAFSRNPASRLLCTEALQADPGPDQSLYAVGLLVHEAWGLDDAQVQASILEATEEGYVDAVVLDMGSAPELRELPFEVCASRGLFFHTGS